MRSLLSPTRIFSLLGVTALCGIFATPAQAGLLREDLYVGSGSDIVGINSGGGAAVFASGFSDASGFAYFGGNYYASDYRSNTVYKLNAHGGKTPFANIASPFDLAFDSSGNLFVVSRPGALYKVTADGNTTLFFTASDILTGMAIDSSDNVFVAEVISNTITKITPGGTSSTFASGLSWPVGLAFDSSGNLFVTNAGDGTISKFTSDGTGSIFFAAIPSPTALAIDFNNNLYVGDQNSLSILKIAPGNLSTFYPSYGGSFMNFAPVPEPSTIALLFGLGAISAAAFVRARRKAK